MPIVTDIDKHIDRSLNMPNRPPKRRPPAKVKMEEAIATPLVPVATNPLQLIDKALSSSAAPEVLSKLMDLQERWEKNEARKAFDAAMAASRAKIEPIIKKREADRSTSGTGRGGKYFYEDMSDIAEVIDPILADNGLNYRHTSKVEAGQLTVTCLLGHAMGHREEGASLSAGLDTSGGKNDVQGLGSTASYLQRYTVKLSLGLAASRDNDGVITKRTEDMQPISQEQYEELKDLLEKADRSPVQLLAFLGYPPTHDLWEISVGNYHKGKAEIARIRAKDAAKAKEESDREMEAGGGTAKP